MEGGEHTRADQGNGYSSLVNSFLTVRPEVVESLFAPPSILESVRADGSPNARGRKLFCPKVGTEKLSASQRQGELWDSQSY